MSGSGQIPRNALIRDLSIVLAGALHPDAQTAPGRVAACRIRDVLRIPDGAPRSAIEARLRAVLADEVLAAFRAVTGWTDEDVLHYASCGNCVPVCGSEEENCPESPAAINMAAYVAQRAQRLAKEAAR